MNTFFKDKIIWITGASSGIGKELAVQLANLDARLILSSRKEESLNELRSSLKNSQNHLVFPLDLENLNGIEHRFQTIYEETGKIDYFFNNGGVSQRGKAGETDLSIDRRIMEIDFFGNITLTKIILPYFRKQQNGHIVIMSSIAGKFGFFLRSAYSAAKHALHGFYESLRLEEEIHNIKVTMVCPGKINTSISMNALGENGQAHGILDHNQETGMSVAECVQKMLKAVECNKKEVLIGNKEILAVYLKRFFPALFYKIIRKQSAV